MAKPFAELVWHLSDWKVVSQNSNQNKIALLTGLAVPSRNNNYRRSMSALLDEKENNHPPDQLCHPVPRALAQRVPDKPAHLRLKPIDPNVGHYDVPKARAFNTSNLCNVGTKNRMNW